MKSWFKILMLLLGGVAVGVAGSWCVLQLVRSDRSKENPISAMNDHHEKIESLRRQLDALQNERDILQRQLVAQQQQLRGSALRKNTPLDETMMLFPSPFPEGEWWPAEKDCEDCWFETIDGLRLHGWYFRHPQPTATIIFMHGNAGNLSHRGPRMMRLRDRLQSSLFIFDYRGYGRSEGRPTLAGTLLDARAARDYIAQREQLATNQIVLMGHSIGGAIAVDVAGRDGARALILENTFSSLRDVASAHYPTALVRLVLQDKLNSVTTIREYQGPLFQSHAAADTIVPLASGQKLFQAANDPKQFLPLKGLDHNDDPPGEYEEQLAAFLKSLP
jgi:fermentation-respiration switch protein FrsA (DUF1100 family)